MATNAPISFKPTKPVSVIPQKQFGSAGIIIKPEDLRPEELAALKELGYDGKSPVPSNIHDLMGATPAQDRQALEAAVAKATARMPDGFKMPTADLDIDSIKTIENDDAVADAVKHYEAKVGKIMAAPKAQPQVTSAFEAARKAGITAINKAVQESAPSNVGNYIDELEHTIDDGSSTPVKPEAAGKQQQESDEKTAESVEDQYNRLIKSLDAKDVSDYRFAVITNTFFSKTYSLLGGQVSVTFRDCGPDEDSLIIRQEGIDAFKGRYNRGDLSAFLDTSSRYSFAAHLQRLTVTNSDGQIVEVIDLPTELSLVEYLQTIDLPHEKLSEVDSTDLPIRVWYRFLVSYAIRGSLYGVVFKKFEEFRNVLRLLRQVAQFPHFFENPA